VSTELGLDAANRIDRLCDEFEQAFKAGGKPEIEAFLGRIEERHRPALLRDLVGLEAELRAGVNDRPRVAEYLQRFPDHKSDVEKVDHTPIPFDETGQREWFVLEVNAKQQEWILGLLSGGEKIHFTFIVFPADEFTMGSPEGESDRQTDEVLHRVKLPRSVAMCDREVTWRQWTAFEGRGFLEAYSKQFNRTLAADEPVFGVNWYEAVGYCRWLTLQARMASTDQCYDEPESLPKDGEGNPKDWPVHLERHGFRLPTEAEWEYSCRSGTSTSFSFGNDRRLLEHYGWFEDNSKWSRGVGQPRPNLRGLFDVHGNVFETCHDWYGEYDPDDSEDVGGVSRGLGRVRRGGSWYSDAARCRSALRDAHLPMSSPTGSGFRLALSPSGDRPEAVRDK